MQLNGIECTIFSFLLLICWNFAFKHNGYKRVTFEHVTHIEAQYHSLLEYRSKSSFLAMAQFFDNDYYSNSQSSSTGNNPSDMFLSLLELQLAIIVQSTNITHAAIYISSESDEQRDNDEEPVMQLVCNYPPTSRDDSDRRNGALDFDDFDDHNDSYESSNNKIDGDDDNDRNRSSSSGNRSTKDSGSDGANDKNGDKAKYSARNSDSATSGNIDEEESDSTYINTDQAAGGVTIYPIQYRGINLGILQTLINKDFSNVDLMQNIPIFDFYHSQRSSTFNSWNPYKIGTVPSGCPVCESVSDAIGASIALEMTRISGLIDLRSANRILREREDNVFLRSSSAIITTRTLLKMLSKRLPKEDEIGLEILKTISDQSDSISDAILELLKNPKENDQDEGEEEAEEEEEEEEIESEEEEIIHGPVSQIVEESGEREEVLIDIENGDDGDEQYDDVICDPTDIPYVVRTLENVHSIHSDKISDQRLERVSVSHFFPHGDVERDEDVTNTGSTIRDIQERANDTRTPEGIDFKFLEKCCIKEEETFVVFGDPCEKIEIEQETETKELKSNSKVFSEKINESQTGREKKEVKSAVGVIKVKSSKQDKVSKKVKKGAT